jgi:hypothetical protein
VGAGAWHALPYHRHIGLSHVARLSRNRACLAGVELVAYPVVNVKLRPHDWWRDLGLARVFAYEYAKYLIAVARLKFVADVWTGSHGSAPDAK